MEKNYSLKSIRTNPSTDFLSVTASIFLGDRRVGALRTCPDTEEIEFDFALPTDRIVFETFISDWWGREDRTMHYDLNVQTIQRKMPDYQPALAIKMRCWVKSIVEPAAKPKSRTLAAA